MFGFVVATVILCVVLGALSSLCMGVAAAIVMLHRVLGVLSLCHVSVVAAVVIPCGVLWVLLSLHMVLVLTTHRQLSPSIVGPGGPLRERQPYTLARRQYLAAKEEVSKEKK